jgi:Spy/CpxP family protein refolding chaperone
MEQRVRTRVATLGILVLVFLAGLMVGFAVDRWNGTKAIAAETAGEGEASKENEPRGRIIDQVDLTHEQQGAVDSIVEHHRQEIAQLQSVYQPRFRAIVDDTREAIKEILTSEQRALYDSLLAKNDERRRENDSRGSRD